MDLLRTSTSSEREFKFWDLDDHRLGPVQPLFSELETWKSLQYDDWNTSSFPYMHIYLITLFGYKICITVAVRSLMSAIHYENVENSNTRCIWSKGYQGYVMPFLSGLRYSHEYFIEKCSHISQSHFQCQESLSFKFHMVER